MTGQHQQRATLAEIAEKIRAPATPEGLIPMFAYAIQEGGLRHGIQLLSTKDGVGSTDRQSLRFRSVADGRVLRLTIRYE